MRNRDILTREMSADISKSSKDNKAKLDYLKELLTDKNSLASDPHAYLHISKVLDKAYGIFSISDEDLPAPEGVKMSIQAKVYMPSNDHNSFNFVGRILGPEGSTAKCLQQCLGVKIMVRGQGSMRDRKKEDYNISKPNWEHLNDSLHVVLSVEDFENRAKVRLAKASDYITRFLKESMTCFYNFASMHRVNSIQLALKITHLLKQSDKDDKVKQMQLMELSLRQDHRSLWHCNLNNLVGWPYPQKPTGLVYPTPLDLFNYAYGYPSAAYFSPMHQSPQPQYTTTLDHQAHPSSQPSHLTAQSTLNNHHHHPHSPYPLGMNTTSPNTTTTLLMGGPQTGYPDPYSPMPYAPVTPPLGSGLAITPVSYWSTSGISPMSPQDYGQYCANGLNGSANQDESWAVYNGHGNVNKYGLHGKGGHSTKSASAQQMNGSHHQQHLNYSNNYRGKGETTSRMPVTDSQNGNRVSTKEVESSSLRSTIRMFPRLNNTLLAEQSKPSNTDSTKVTEGVEPVKSVIKPLFVPKDPTTNGTTSPAARSRAARSTMVTVKVGSGETAVKNGFGQHRQHHLSSSPVATVVGRPQGTGSVVGGMNGAKPEAKKVAPAVAGPASDVDWPKLAFVGTVNPIVREENGIAKGMIEVSAETTVN